MTGDAQDLAKRLTRTQLERLHGLVRATLDPTPEGRVGIYRFWGANARATERVLVGLGLAERYEWIPPKWKVGLSTLRATELGCAVAAVRGTR